MATQQQYIDVDLIAGSIRSKILQVELDGLKKAWKGKNINPIHQAIQVTVVCNDIAKLRTLDQIKEYLLYGDIMDKASVNEYIAGLYLEANFSYN